jgi:hypothetical protein
MAYHCGVAAERLNTETKVNLLRDEYLLIQKQYEDFDGRIMTIKGWSATVGFAAIGAGFQYTKYLWLVAAGICATFWILEAIWKTLQYCYSERIKWLERAFETGRFNEIQPFQIYTEWSSAFSETGWGAALRENMTLGVVFFPHIVAVVAGPLIFVLNLCIGFQYN